MGFEIVIVNSKLLTHYLDQSEWMINSNKQALIKTRTIHQTIHINWELTIADTTLGGIKLSHEEQHKHLSILLAQQ